MDKNKLHEKNTFHAQFFNNFDFSYFWAKIGLFYGKFLVTFGCILTPVIFLIREVTCHQSKNCEMQKNKKKENFLVNSIEEIENKIVKFVIFLK